MVNSDRGYQHSLNSTCDVGTPHQRPLHEGCALLWMGATTPRHGVDIARRTLLPGAAYIMLDSLPAGELDGWDMARVF